MRLDAATRGALAQLTSDGTRTSTAVREAIIKAAAQQATPKQRPADLPLNQRQRLHNKSTMSDRDDPDYLAWVTHQAEAAPPLTDAQIGVLFTAFTKNDS